MNKIFLLPFILLLASLSVSAMTVEYTFEDEYGNPLDDVDVLVYTCQDSTCTTVRNPDFMIPNKINSNDEGSGNDAVINYPASLESAYGYAVYFYRDGYLPNEFFVNAYGIGTRSVEKIFYKKEVCSAPIDSFSVEREVEAHMPLVIDVNTILEADAHSAFSLTSDTPIFLPAEYRENFYSALTDVQLKIIKESGEEAYSDNSVVNIFADDSERVIFTWTPEDSGDYTAVVTTKVIDDQCKSTLPMSADKDFRVLSEEPSNLCYTLLNNLALDDPKPRVGQLTEISGDKISNYVDSSGNLHALPTKIDLSIFLDGTIVHEDNALISANPDTINPAAFDFDWTPDALGNYTIEVRAVADSCPVAENNAETERIGVDVREGHSINHDPFFTDILESIEIREDVGITLTFEAEDADGDLLFFSSDNLPEGATLDRETGVFAWRPGFDFVKHDSGVMDKILTWLKGVPVPEEEFVLSLEVEDMEGGFDSESILITVIDVNRRPDLESLEDVSVREGETIRVSPSATDEDGDDVEFSFSAPLDGDGVWETEIGDAGTYFITVTAIDGFGGEDEESFDIVVESIGGAGDPIFTSTPVTTAFLGEIYSYDADAYDPDGTRVTYSLQRKPTGMSINRDTGLITWTPRFTGNYNIRVRAVDEDGGISEQRFNIDVNRGEISFVKSHKLRIPSVHALDDTLQPGESALFFAKIKNTGNMKEKEVSVRMIVHDLEITQTKRISLGRGQGKLAIFEFNVPEDAKSGEYLVSFHIISGNEQTIKYATFEVK